MAMTKGTRRRCRTVTPFEDPENPGIKQRFGTRRQVINGTALMTTGRKTKDDFMRIVKPNGTVRWVSRRMHEHGLRMAANLRPYMANPRHKRFEDD